jgi:hypothetical protein
MKEQGIIGYISHPMEAAFEELIKGGMIEKEKMDSFNLPVLCPNVEALENILRMEKSFEILERVHLFSGFTFLASNSRGEKKNDEKMFKRMVTNNFREAFENLMRAHLCSDVLTNEFFLKIEAMETSKCQDYVCN